METNRKKRIFQLQKGRLACWMILDLVCAKTLPLLAAKVENVFYTILYIYFILYTCVLYLCSSFCIVFYSVLFFKLLIQAVIQSSVQFSSFILCFVSVPFQRLLCHGKAKNSGAVLRLRLFILLEFVKNQNHPLLKGGYRNFFWIFHRSRWT